MGKAFHLVGPQCSGWKTTLAILEPVFDTRHMSVAVQSLVDQLASRVRTMEGRTPGAWSALPVSPTLASLLPQGLRIGNCYAVRGSLSLAVALLAEASASGRWCGVIGIPEFGAEAAATLGVDLSRLLLVPDPQQEWLTVVATMVEVLPLVLVRAPAHVPPKDLGRLEARIRRQGCVLVVLVEHNRRWPRATVNLEAGRSEWFGIASGRGVLSEREMVVRVTDRSGQGREVRLRQRNGAYVAAAPAQAALRRVG